MFQCDGFACYVKNAQRMRGLNDDIAWRFAAVQRDTMLPDGASVDDVL